MGFMDLDIIDNGDGNVTSEDCQWFGGCLQR